MPQLSGAGGGGGGDPELCATDEMIPFKDEGDPQKEKIFAEISHPEEEGDLADIKSSLVNESEIIPASNGHEVARQAQTSQESYHDKAREHPDDGKHPDGGLYNKGPSYSSYSGYIMMPNMNNDPYMSNGSLSPPIPRTSNKVPVVQPSHAVHPLTPLITYSDEHFSPGSHPSHIPSDVNSKQGMSRHPPAPEIPTFYPLSPGGVGQITPPLGWQGQPVYPITGGFRQPYPSSLSVDTSMSRFSHHMIPGPPGPHTTGIPHPAIVTPQVKQEHPHTDSDLMHVKPQHEQRKEQEPKRPHIKKPLNAFMLYMKEMRANVVAELDQQSGGWSLAPECHNPGAQPSPRLWLESGEGQGANRFKVHVADLCFCFSHWISSSSVRPPLISVSASKGRRGGTWLSGQNENTDSSFTCCPFRKSPRAHGGSSAQLPI